ncbi:hypothetical protein BN1723_004073 [Verticillium longisporum]|uniref:Bms1-type G domain-containing protein n=1 Tax=Verticillium longisporum TaxID=100787 RepID=A0A0G4MJU1_VERLO|nr:hypothetical protein BN1723_004073 [Verticillium longisporum]
MSHSHRSTTKVSHKPFKSKHATKSALRNAAKGKVAGTEKGQRKTPHQNVMSKFDRRNQAKQHRLTKQKEHLEETSLFAGRDGAPRVVAIVPLCEDSDVSFAIKQLNESLDIEADMEENPFRVSVDRFKQKLQYVPLKRDLNAVLDGTRVADFVVVMLSAGVEVDPLGELMLRSLESQGMSTLYTIVQGLDKIEPAKQKTQALVGGVPPGTRVAVHLKNVPVTFEKSYKPGQPVTLVSLLRHEQKKTVVNYLINLSSDYEKSVKSKEELIVQCGARRFTINPLFSQPGNTPNDVHKYCRYLHPGQSAVATFTGPVTWGAVPVLFFKRTTPNAEAAQSEEEQASDVGLTLIATGTALPPSTSRVVAKRVILTGHPYHINKRIVTIRYMFFNREDVEWFKALPLWTRRGRSGYVKEALGTHGYFKATFDAHINPQDAVGVSLYKRVWPREASAYTGALLDLGSREAQAAQDDMMIE